nr:uncharacterized protein LOC117280857 isoform X1 [Nicotiana tomentosiformis]
MTENIKRKFSSVLFDNLKIYHKLKKRKRKGFDFSPAPSSSKLPTSTTTPRKPTLYKQKKTLAKVVSICGNPSQRQNLKRWAKVLKAASKHFKKKRKKKDSTGHLNLSNCLNDN